MIIIQSIQNSLKASFLKYDEQKTELFKMKELKIFAPATIANVSCGFDILGLCLDTVGDEMVIRKSNNKGVKIAKIDTMYPWKQRKTSGVAILALLQQLNTMLDLRSKYIKKSTLEVE